MTNLAAWQLFLLLKFTQYFLCSAQSCLDYNGRFGICMSATSCQQQQRNHIFYGVPTIYALGLTYGAQSYCGVQGNQLLICCLASQGQYTQPTAIATANTIMQSAFQFGSLNSNVVNSQAVNSSIQPIEVMEYKANTLRTPIVYRPVPPTGKTSSIPPRDANNNIPKSQVCGVSMTTKNRVVGGSDARKGSYPWLAALGYAHISRPNAISYLCAGSLIKPNYVLTAAHCVNTNLTLARLGAHLLDQQRQPDVVDIQIRRYVVHEQYDATSITNDIALVELVFPAPSTDFIGLICLPKTNEFRGDNLVGMNPFIAGWGSTRFQGPTSKTLREAQVPIINVKMCKQNYASVFQNVKIDEKVICAGTSSVDACQGDSGGPLMLPQSDNMGNYHYYLLGIVSYGYECAHPGFPGVYTNVASYIQWIQSRS